MSGCLLNENLRFPGIAVKEGAVYELLEPLIKNGVGIEQLPCLERMEWGGVSRKKFFKFLPITFNTIGTRKHLLIELFIKIWIHNFRKSCKKEAKKVVNHMEDFMNSGYVILGIIAMNDSPTCGFTKTINLLKSASTFKKFGLKLEDFENPDLEKMRGIIPNLCKNGTGLFMAEILRELRKRHINVKIFEFNPWNNLIKESERIINALNLKFTLI